MTVAGFPCNQFGNQEPGSAEEIREFVTTKYDVDFPMFAKVDVNGENACELYTFLKEAQPGSAETSDIAWNFEKFLVDGDGSVVARFGPQVTPEDVQAELPALLSR